MNMTMVIPSYWSRESAVGWKERDAIYDHPTPLDAEGTLQRAIESIEKLEDKEFQLVILAVATAKAIESKVEKKGCQHHRVRQRRSGSNAVWPFPS